MVSEILQTSHLVEWNVKANGLESHFIQRLIHGKM